MNEDFRKKMMALCDSYNELCKEKEKEMDPFSLNNAATFFLTSIYWLERAITQKNNTQKS
jgi:hypothetical protein